MNIERAGGLPAYVHSIACSIHEKRGLSIQASIRIALDRIRVWARGGKGVDPKTQAKAAKALAQWEALRAKSKAKRVAASVSETALEKILRLTK